MRFTIAREKLQEALTSVTAAVPTKTTLPVLANILVEASDHGVRLSGTDLDVAVSVQVPAEVESPGALTLPAKRLGEIVRELPPSPVKLAALGEQRATLECARTKFKLLGLPREEYPAFPAVDFTNAWRVKSALLHEMIGRTAFAASTEESRPILNGVLWEVRASQMRMVATNGHRLALLEVAAEQPETAGGDFIVPPRALEQVRKVFPPDEELEIGRGENHLAFRSPLASVSTRLIEGPYPNYDQVIPRDNDRIAIVDRTALVGALRRMAVVASDQTHRVKLSFNAALLRFTVQTPDIGEGQDEIGIEYSGDQLDIGFNTNYLLEILRYMPTDEIKFTFKTAERAATILPDKWNSTARYVCLVMPLRLVD
jgi:DNA polymerase III subunit beta